MNAVYDNGGALQVHDVGRAQRADSMARDTRPTGCFHHRQWHQATNFATISSMKIAAMREAFTDQWVAAKVLKVDRTNVPLTGEVLSHSSEKQEVYQAAKAYLMQHPTARLFIFFTGDPIPEGVEAMLAFR